jgi:glucose-6-phosphate isomerase
VPANLAGRYAVLGSATLFVAGMCGIDIAALIKGGADMDRRCRNGDAANNPAYMHSLVHYLLTRKRRKTIHQTVAYGDRLSAVAQWYDHLLAVSLGKMLNRKGKAVHVGPSPMSARGAFDNHGQMQLIAEGPFDKVITFITARDHGVKVQAPITYPKLDSVAFSGNAECGTLMDHAFVAAEQSVTVSGRPNCVIILDRVDEAHIGGLVYLFELSTAMSAELYGIDPFDQPLVEHNKHAAYALLGRAGFEDLGRKLAEHRKLPRRAC